MVRPTMPSPGRTVGTLHRQTGEMDRGHRRRAHLVRARQLGAIAQHPRKSADDRLHGLGHLRDVATHQIDRRRRDAGRRRDGAAAKRRKTAGESLDVDRDGRSDWLRACASRSRSGPHLLRQAVHAEEIRDAMVAAARKRHHANRQAPHARLAGPHRSEAGRAPRRTPRPIRSPASLSTPVPRAAPRRSRFRPPPGSPRRPRSTSPARPRPNGWRPR